jgi:hypothetical protein
MKKSALILILVVLTGACTNMSKLNTVKTETDPYRIMVVTLKIIKATDDYSITLTNSKIFVASPKNIDPEPDKWRENDFFCLVLDKSKRICDSLLINQPLHPRYEYPLDNGSIGSQVVNLNENEVMLRFRYFKDYKWLKVGVIEKDNYFKPLKTIEILTEN